jgi:hypothetical protein
VGRNSLLGIDLGADQKIIEQINRGWIEKQVKIWDEIDYLNLRYSSYTENPQQADWFEERGNNPRSCIRFTGIGLPVENMLIPSCLHRLTFVVPVPLAGILIALHYYWGSHRPLHQQSLLEPPPQLASLAPAPVLPQGGSALRCRLGAPSNATWYHFAPAATFARVRLRNFCFSAKDRAFSSLDGCPGQPDTGSNEIFGIILLHMLRKVTSSRYGKKPPSAHEETGCNFLLQPVRSNTQKCTLKWNSAKELFGYLNEVPVSSPYGRTKTSN